MLFPPTHVTHIFLCLTGTSHLTSLKSKFVIPPSPEMFLCQSSLSQQMEISSLGQDHPCLFSFITTHMQPTTNSRHQNIQNMANSYHFLPSSLPQVIIFHLDYCNDFCTGLPDSALPNLQTLADILFSTQ